MFQIIDFYGFYCLNFAIILTNQAYILIIIFEYNIP